MEDLLFIRVDKTFVRLAFSDIMIIKADGARSQLLTNKGEFRIEMSLKDVVKRLKRPEFMRVHRSFAININNIQSIDERGVVIGDKLVPINKTSRTRVLNTVGYI